MSDSENPTGETMSSAPASASASAEPVTPPTANPVADKLREFGASDEAVAKLKDELGVTGLDDLSLLTEQDLVGAGLKPIPARKLLGSLKPTAAAQAPVNTTVVDAVLPSVPDDGPWLEALRTGGVLKVEQSTVISAIRAALAKRIGLFEVPKTLADAMEQFADNNDEQVDPEFFKLRKQVTRRSYGDIFEAIDGLDGSFVSEARKKQLFERVDRHLWSAIMTFYDQLKSWQENWMQQSANPAMFVAALANMGGGGTALPPGMMQPPDTAAIRDYADAVNDAINRVFAGTGVQIAAALAVDAMQIKKTLENPRLPQMIGVANREQMLKQLGIAVSSSYPRLEVNLTRFVLATMQAKNQPSGNEELQYFGSLSMLGSQIPWGELGGRSTVTGIGGRRRDQL